MSRLLEKGENLNEKFSNIFTPDESKWNEWDNQQLILCVNFFNNQHFSFEFIRWIQSLRKGKIGQKYKLRVLKRFSGKSLKILSVGEDDMILDYLERAGIDDEDDQLYVVKKMKKLIDGAGKKQKPSDIWE